MNPFCLRCGVDVSIQNSVNLQAKYNKMDTYLSVLRKNWLQIKADVHYLPHAVFTGMEKKNLSPNYLSYKQIFREAIKEIKMADKYIDSRYCGLCEFCSTFIFGSIFLAFYREKSLVKYFDHPVMLLLRGSGITDLLKTFYGLLQRKKFHGN